MGRETTSALEYWNDDLVVEEEERVLCFGLVLEFDEDGFIVEIGRRVRGKEREWLLTWLSMVEVEEHVKKKRGNRSMQSFESETGEGTEKAIAKQRTKIFFLVFVSE